MGRNAVLIFLGKVFAPAASFGIVYVLGLVRGVEPVGQFNTVMAFLSLFQIFGGLGLDTYLTREAARSPGDVRALLRGALSYILPLCLASVPLAIVVAWAAGYPTDILVGVSVGSLALTPFAIVAQHDALFVGLGRSRTVAMVSLCESVLRLTLSTAVIFFQPDLVLLIAAHVVAKTVAWGLYAAAVSRLPAAPGPARHPPLGFRTVATFLGILLAYSLFWKADVLLLSRFRGDYDAGLYSMASKLVMVFFLIPSSVVTAAVPLLSASYADDRKRFQKTIADVAGILSFLVVPVCAVLGVRGADVFRLLGLGPGFSGAGGIVSILAGVLLMMSCIELLFRTLLAAGLERTGLRVALRSVTLGVALVGLAAWSGGPRWTAWALLGAAAFDLAQDGFYVARLMPGLWRPALRALATAIPLTLLLYLLRPMNLALSILIAGMAHLALSHATGVMRLQTAWSLLRELRPARPDPA